MIARVTLAEIDAVRLNLDDAVERFKESVMPALAEQEGFEGAYVLVTPEGKALVLTFWESEDSSQAAVSSGFYEEQVRKFVTFYRTPPGRATYDVVLAEPPAAVIH
jgi:heme-degrading monooxygenase HmoA